MRRWRADIAWRSGFWSGVAVGVVITLLSLMVTMLVLQALFGGGG